MALDWSKNINFAGLLKRKPRSKDVYPSKTYMNMALPDERELNIRRTVLMVIVGVLAAAVFFKFGVFDFYARVAQKSAELTARSQVLADVQSQLTDYNDVLATYRTYEAARMTAEAGDIAALDALALVDNYILPAAQLDSLGLKDNVLSLELSGISLDSVGGLVSTLYEQPIVTGVRVATATDATNSREKTVTMTISLQSTAATAAASSDAVAGAGTTGNAGENVLTDEEKTEIRQEVISALSGNGQTYTDSATAVAERNAQNNS